VSDLVRVWAGGDVFEAEMVRGRLEAEGIRVLTKGEGEGPYRVGPVYLFVPAEDVTEARIVLDAIASGAYALDADDGPFEDADAGDPTGS
jgi:hypothetical protein